MKKLLLPLLSILLLTACQKEITKENLPEEIAGAANRTSPKITICHYDTKKEKWNTIEINLTALPEHLAHNDIVPDADGDGYTKVNPCGNGSQDDCNDNNAAIKPGATEVCGDNIDNDCDGQIDENCNVPAIGGEYGGGIVAYILQPGDPGYNANVPHGLIAAPNDQMSTPGIQWYNGSSIATGATGTALGTGLSNTNLIVAAQGPGSYAAKLCADLVLNTFSDWYLPSKDELEKLYINQGVIGGFSAVDYWSSSEVDITLAWMANFTGSGLLHDFKGNSNNVRAVRAF